MSLRFYCYFSNLISSFIFPPSPPSSLSPSPSFSPEPAFYLISSSFSFSHFSNTYWSSQWNPGWSWTRTSIPTAKMYSPSVVLDTFGNLSAAISFFFSWGSDSDSINSCSSFVWNRFGAFQIVSFVITHFSCCFWCNEIGFLETIGTIVPSRLRFSQLISALLLSSTVPHLGIRKLTHGSIGSWFINSLSSQVSS